MNYAYIVRMPNDSGPFARHYGIKYLQVETWSVPREPITTIQNTLRNVDPPVLRRRRGNHSECDYANKYMSTRDFHRLYPHIRLKPGEGPILVDLNVISKKRTSRHPNS